jgi:aldose 1-epimerase
VPSPDKTHTTVLQLRCQDLHLEIAPETGGSIARFFSVLPGGRTLHWLRPARELALSERDPLGLAGFPLAPWCNRIRNGLSFFGKRTVRLAPDANGSPHPMHGTAWRAPWQVVQAGEDSALMRQIYRPPPEGEDGWPYAFEAEQRVQLRRDGLTLTISVTNRSDDEMPAGLGHHPCFPRGPGTRLTAEVGAMWASDADLLPIGLAVPPFLARMAQGLEIGELDLDNNFVGWSHEARIDWPEEGHALVMRAEPPLDYFALLCPRGEDHFVMEPVSNCTDWMNLTAKGQSRVGGTVLAPGETLSGRFTLQPLPA